MVQGNIWKKQVLAEKCWGVCVCFLTGNRASVMKCETSGRGGCQFVVDHDSTEE